MSRPSSDLQGVTWEGENGVYTIRQSGRIVGTVWRAKSRHSTWTARNTDPTSRVRFTGPNRAAATAGLIGWLQEADVNVLAEIRANLIFTVDGVPKPKGSLRHVGHGRMVEQVADSAPWRERVLWAARKAAERDGWERAEGRVAVHIVASYERPKSAPKRRPWYPITRSSGDADKIARNILDALVDAGLIKDDSHVTELHVSKVEADSQPGAWIMVKAVTP